MDAHREAPQLQISPADALAGIGGADRELLATCLALFHDSRLYRRMQRLAKEGGEAALRRYRGGSQDPPDEEDVRCVHDTRRQWIECDWSDDELRLYLWIQLRTALDLPPRLSASWRGCGHLANDLTATLIASLDPPGLVNSGKRWLCQRGWMRPGEQATTLADVVVPVLDELIEKAQEGEPSALDRETRREMLARALATMVELTEADHEALLRETGADDVNDRVVRNSLLLGGSLGAFGVGVSTAGFSAYILAAQVSAFIPLVSGPALVSVFAVLTNPVTIVGGTAAGVWYWHRTARRMVNSAIAARVVAPLTIQGLRTGRSGLHATCRSFGRLPGLVERGALARRTGEAWLEEWRFVESQFGERSGSPPDWLLRKMDAIVDNDSPDSALSSGSTAPTGDERQNAVVMGGLIAGDVLYSAAAIDPMVIKAADFSRVADIDGHIAFSQLAAEILDDSKEAVQGGTNQLFGYVAERAIAGELASAGHTVSFPDAPNQPGYDLLVDGQPFQVKFHADAAGIRDHFARYDYPVLANSELSEDIPEELQDRVFFVDGVSNELVDDITKRSLDAGDEMLDPGAVAPAGVISATRGVMAYRSGQISGQQAVEQILVDGSVRAGLAGTASYVGVGVGTLVFGPAGGLVFATVLPAIAAMQTRKISALARKHLKGDRHRQWEDVAHRRLDELRDVVLRGLARKQEAITEKITATPDNDAGRYLGWRLEDDRRHGSECRARLLDVKRERWDLPEQRAAELFRWLAISGVHQGTYQSELRAVAGVIGERPGLRELMSRQGFGRALNHGKEAAEDWWKTARDGGFNGWMTGATEALRKQRPAGDDRQD